MVTILYTLQTVAIGTMKIELGRFVADMSMEENTEQ